MGKSSVKPLGKEDIRNACFEIGIYGKVIEKDRLHSVLQAVVGEIEGVCMSRREGACFKILKKYFGRVYPDLSAGGGEHEH